EFHTAPVHRADYLVEIDGLRGAVALGHPHPGLRRHSLRCALARARGGNVERSGRKIGSGLFVLHRGPPSGTWKTRRRTQGASDHATRTTSPEVSDASVLAGLRTRERALFCAPTVHASQPEGQCSMWRSF